MPVSAWLVARPPLLPCPGWVVGVGGHVFRQVTAKAQRVLKFKPTDFPTALKETYRWYLRHSPFPAQDYKFEDMLLTHAPTLSPPEPVRPERKRA